MMQTILCSIIDSYLEIFIILWRDDLIINETFIIDIS